MADDIRAAKRRRFSSSPITLQVGPPATPTLLYVNQSILEDSSPFFTSAIVKSWVAGQTRHVCLPYEDVNIVSAYLDYLYCHGQLHLDGSAPDFAFLVRMYSFAERVDDDACCDAVMVKFVNAIDEMTEKGEAKLPALEVVDMVYEGTAKESLLRKCLVEVYAQRMTGAVEVDGLNREFTGDLLKEVLKIRPLPKTYGTVAMYTRRWLKIKQ